MLCLCDYRTPEDILLALESRGFEVVPIPADSALPTPVNGHTDLNVFAYGKTITLRADYHERNRSLFDRICSSAGLELFLSKEKAGSKYPLDCGLCAAVSGKSFLYCAKSTDTALVSRFKGSGYKLLTLPQGYVKCSCAILSDGSVITADRGISKLTQDEGIDTLVITPGHVDLKGYGYGFIGGATGLCGDTLYVCGDLALHPDGRAIEAFAEKHGTKCVSLGCDKLYDVGSLLFL